METIVLNTKFIIDSDTDRDIKEEINNFKFLLAFFTIKNEIINQSKSTK